MHGTLDARTTLNGLHVVLYITFSQKFAYFPQLERLNAAVPFKCHLIPINGTPNYIIQSNTMSNMCVGEGYTP